MLPKRLGLQPPGPGKFLTLIMDTSAPCSKESWHVVGGGGVDRQVCSAVPQIYWRLPNKDQVGMQSSMETLSPLPVGVVIKWTYGYDLTFSDWLYYHLCYLIIGTKQLIHGLFKHLKSTGPLILQCLHVLSPEGTTVLYKIICKEHWCCNVYPLYLLTLCQWK